LKLSHIIIVLAVFAWPLYKLYDLQLGAVSFLLLAIFFSVVTVKEVKKLKKQKEMEQEKKKQEKFNRN
jgi:membrane protein implicated in regulation of membrane protease activity